MRTITNLDSRSLFSLLVALVATLRLAELAIASRNFRRLLARGAVEAGPAHYRWMVLVHTAVLVGCPLEVWLLRRPFLPRLAAPALVLVVLAMALRYWVLLSLSDRWTTRVVCLPGEPLVTSGPYRYMRHPNYLAVVTELAALPLVHTAWLTATIGSLANAWVLRVRVVVEEAALARYAPSGSGTPAVGRPSVASEGR